MQIGSVNRLELLEQNELITGDDQAEEPEGVVRWTGRHFDREIIILCVRWYLRYKLSLRVSGELSAHGILGADGAGCVH